MTELAPGRVELGSMPTGGMVRSAKSKFDIIMSCLLILGAYTSVSIFKSDSILIPSVVSLICASIILSVRFSAISPAVMEAIFLIIGLSVAQTVVLHIFGVIDLFATLLPLGNFLVSLLTGYALYISLIRVGSSGIKQILFWFWFMLVIGAWAELYLGLDVLSNAFREALFPRYMYEADLRDSVMFGGVRPKVFSPEPSYVGVWFLVTAISWLAVASPRSVWLEALIVVLATATIGLALRSGTLIFAIPLIICAVVYRISKKQASGHGSSAIFTLAVVGVVAASWLLNYADLRSAPLFIRGDSFFARILAPPRAAVEALSRDPLFGMGISNDPRMVEVVTPIFGRRDLIMMRSGEITSADWLLTNSFFYHWIYFGLVLGLIMAAVYLHLARILSGNGAAFALAATSISWFTIGGYTNVQSWCIAFLFCAVAATHSVDLAQNSAFRRSAALAGRVPK